MEHSVQSSEVSILACFQVMTTFILNMIIAIISDAYCEVDQEMKDEKKALEGDDADPEGLAEAEKALEGAQATLAEAQKTLDEAQKTLTEAEAAKDAVLQYPSRAFVANVVREDRIPEDHLPSVWRVQPASFGMLPTCAAYVELSIHQSAPRHPG